jgi:hypothetical protein
MTGASLCHSCRNGHIVRGRRFHEELVRCSSRGSMEPIIIPFIVTACNEYDNRATTTLWDMKEIAWKVDPDRVGRAGFCTRPKPED